MALKLSTDEIRYIALFESMTGAVVKDCIADSEESKIIFVVKKGDAGLAIGRKGANIQRVKESIGKKIEIIEYSENPAEFLKNIFYPLRVKKVSLDKNVAHIEIDERDRDFAIGRKGKNIQKAKLLAARHHSIENVVIE